MTVCERMGWTLDYYDSVSAPDILDMLEIWKHMDSSGTG
jgi:hypothetical protein